MKFKRVEKKIRKALRKPEFNHGYSTGQTGRTFIDAEKRFSYDYVAYVVRSLVIQMQKDLTRYYASLPGFDDIKAKKRADKIISERLHPIAKEAEKDEASATVFYEKVAAMYKRMGLSSPQFNFRYFYNYSEPEITDTKL